MTANTAMQIWDRLLTALLLALHCRSNETMQQLCLMYSIQIHTAHYAQTLFEAETLAIQIEWLAIARKWRLTFCHCKTILTVIC